MTKSSRIWGWFYSKEIQGLHFMFFGELISSICFWVICPWNKIEEKAHCERIWMDIKRYRSKLVTEKQTVFNVETRGWVPKLGIVKKLYKWSSCPLAKMIPALENNFGKITAWSLIYFLNYAKFDILTQSQILGLTL